MAGPVRLVLRNANVCVHPKDYAADNEGFLVDVEDIHQVGFTAVSRNGSLPMILLGTDHTNGSKGVGEAGMDVWRG